MQATMFEDPDTVPPVTGRHLVPVSGGLVYWPTVAPGDVLRLNLDVREVAGAGLYLCEFLGAGGKPWRGVRRFKPSSGKQAFDHSGRGDFIRLSDYEAGRMKVLGRVEQVFKPAH